jgi:hypothetical protein
MGREKDGVTYNKSLVDSFFKTFFNYLMYNSLPGLLVVLDILRSKSVGVKAEA